jgi:hypothetical protein
MEPFEDDRLVSALESLRPQPRPAFAAELDERAAAGFPRRARGSALRRFAERMRSIEPRRALIPAGATALAAVAAATLVVAVNEPGQPSSGLHFSGEEAGRPPAISRGHNLNFDGAGKYKYGRATAAPQTGSTLGKLSKFPKGSVESSSAASAGAASSAESSVRQLQPFSRDVGPYASRSTRREIERSAQLVLGTEPAQVRKAASEVFETVHAYRGIVLNSSIRDGDEGEAGARFSLLIPSAKLGDAMADFSGIGAVRSRREATADITAPTIRTGELLRDSRATIEGLLAQLAQADTDAERAATEAKLRAERGHAAFLRSQLSSLQRRANLSRVQLRIESGTASDSGATGGWGVGDALDDAGHILAIAAGVTIVGLAVLGPIALIALLAWLANRARVKRARHRALA